MVEPNGSQELVSLANQDVQNVFAIARYGLVDVRDDPHYVGGLVGFERFDGVLLSEVVVGPREKEQQVRSGAKPKFLQQRSAVRTDAGQKLQRLSQ